MILRQTQSQAVLLLILSFQLLFVSAKAERLKEVLILNSYHYGFQWTADINNAIADHFKGDESVRIFYEFMDSKRFNSEDYFQALHKQYLIKYQGHPIDGIICTDNRAFDFFIQHGKEIWGDIPATFCGVNNINEQLYRIDTSKHTIVHEILDIKGTIELIEQLQPELEELTVISDETLSGNIFLEQFINAFNSQKRHYSYQIINNTEPGQLRQALSSLPTTNRAIYLLSLYTERNGIPNEMLNESHYFFKDVNIPLYSNWDFLMPNLIVGGRVLKGYDQGKLSARLMQQILNTQAVELHNYPPTYTVLDEPLLKKFAINTELVTSDFTLINEEISLIKRYKKELIVVLSILIVFVFIILLLVSDIIKRKRIEISFIESEKRLELAISGAGEGLWDVEISKNYVYIDEQFATMLGYDSSGELHIDLDNWPANVLPQDVEQMREAFSLHKTGKAEAFQCEVRLLKKDQTYSWFSIHGKITELLNDEPNRITGVILNIADQKAFENELHKAKEKAEESDRLKSSFLANMSHEIRTPMNAILGFTDLLLYGQLNQKEQSDYLQMIKRGGENLLTLINDIIDISKIESGELKIKKEFINIHELVNEAYEMSLSLANSLKKKIDIRVTPSIAADEAIMFTDPLRVYQILLNLLSNAVKFTDRGHVDISYGLDNGENLWLTVTDTGPGISPKDMQLIFDRFRQIDESTNKKHGGTGLGLSITKSLVELMNGHIELISDPPNGAQFTIVLPVKLKHQMVQE